MRNWIEDVQNAKRYEKSEHSIYSDEINSAS